MEGLKPLESDELKKFAFILNAVQKNMGFVPNSMKTMARMPAIMASFSNLAALLVGDPEKTSPLLAIKLAFKNLFWSANLMKNPDRVPLYLRNLVAYMSSNAAGCRYCQAHTIGEALHNGVPPEKIEALWNFENSDAFDEKERSALRFALASGAVPNQVTQEHFTELRKHFSEVQITELGATVALFGFLNRWNDTFATQLEGIPLANAKKHIGSQGWEVGKHEY